MDYSRLYYKIIENRKNNTFNGYTECHHILPKSLGGTNDKSNLVDLTAREHFICHLLLTKMYPVGTNEWHKMIKAFNAMCWLATKKQQRFSNNKHYEWLREKFSKVQSKCQSGSGNSQYNKVWIHNAETNQARKIAKEDSIPEGWKLGRSTKVVLVKPNKEKIRQEKCRQNAELLYNAYINGNYTSIREFCRAGKYEFSHVSLTKLWKKYIPEYKEKVEKGKRFIRS